MKRSAVCVVPRLDGKVLAVWHKKRGGWALPGGKCEVGEPNRKAAARELKEETGLDAVMLAPLFLGASSSSDDPTEEPRWVYAFLAAASGEPRECEEGSPVLWITFADLCEISPFGDFYRRMRAWLAVEQPWAADALAF